MKRKPIIILFLLAIIFFITAVLVVNEGGGTEAPETSIRNATKRPITFRIIEGESSEDPREKTLNPGEIYRYRSWTEHEVTVVNKDEAITMQLNPSTPYVFRIYEDDNVEIYPGSHGRSDADDLAPFVATPMEIVDKMLSMVKLGKDDILYDLGCGDGRIVIAAARQFKVKGVGIDLVPQRIRECREMARKAGVEDRVTFIEKDVFKVDISRATVVAIYLLPDSNEVLRPFLEKQLKPGVHVISHNYPIAGWDAKRIDYQECKDKDDEVHLLYLYRR